MSRSDAQQIRKATIYLNALVDRFCGTRAIGFVADPGTKEKDGVRVSKGRCGCIGGKATACLLSVNDGYDFMDYLSERN